jgi:hypothetical protein
MTAAESLEPYIERDGRFWQVVYPAGPNNGFDMATGPHFTKLGARLSLRFNRWLEGPR